MFREYQKKEQEAREKAYIDQIDQMAAVEESVEEKETGADDSV